MNVLGVELELDFFDADQIEVYEKENERVVERIKEPSQYEGKSTADSFRIQCGIIDDFFDAVFGSGTSDKLFHGKSNLKDHMEAFGIVSESAKDSRKDLDAVMNKYGSNRAERRQHNKQQGKKNFQNFQKPGRVSIGKGGNR